MEIIADISLTNYSFHVNLTCSQQHGCSDWIDMILPTDIHGYLGVGRLFGYENESKRCIRAQDDLCSVDLYFDPISDKHSGAM